MNSKTILTIKTVFDIIAFFVTVILTIVFLFKGEKNTSIIIGFISLAFIESFFIDVFWLLKK